MKKQTIGAPADVLAAASEGCAAGCASSPQMLTRFHAAIGAVAGKWKLEIVCALFDGALRFGELRRALPGITQHMLTAQLRELEASGLLTRTAYAEVPPRVEYALTEAAHALLPVFRALNAWAERHGDILAGRETARKTPRKNARAQPAVAA